MRSETMEKKMFDDESRLPSLSIVIDDFDGAKSQSCKEPKTDQDGISQRPPKPYTRSSSDASIKKILEEAEHRKHEFWKLLDEHNAVIENLKRIEKLECNTCKMAQPSIKI